jgi:hypothetical protein
LLDPFDATSAEEDATDIAQAHDRATSIPRDIIATFNLLPATWMVCRRAPCIVLLQQDPN